jgi:hypothetical protein
VVECSWKKRSLPGHAFIVVHSTQGTSPGAVLNVAVHGRPLINNLNKRRFQMVPRIETYDAVSLHVVGYCPTCGAEISYVNEPHGPLGGSSLIVNGKQSFGMIAGCTNRHRVIHVHGEKPVIISEDFSLYHAWPGEFQIEYDRARQKQKDFTADQMDEAIAMKQYSALGDR